MENIVISIGGSVILSEEANVSFLKKLAEILKILSDKYKLFIVVGGGKTARYYIKKGRDQNLKEDSLDELGIGVTRVNAKFLTSIIENSNDTIPTTTDEAIKMKDKIIIMGGTTPNHSTDMVGAELAEKVGAKRFIIATNVDGIYDKDPNKFQDAKQIKEIHINKLIEKYGTGWKSAGSNVVVDGPALKIIARSNITTYVLNGKNLDQLRKSIDGLSFDGTVIEI